MSDAQTSALMRDSSAAGLLPSTRVPSRRSIVEAPAVATRVSCSVPVLKLSGTLAKTVACHEGWLHRDTGL